MKLLALTRYGPLGASSRYRTYQYLPHLRAQGIDVTVQPLLDDRYLRQSYAGRSPFRNGAIAAYARRVAALSQASSFDMIWIEKEALPWLPTSLERMLLRLPYVVDYDDALFHRYDIHRSRLVRWVLGDKISTVMSHAALVIAGSPYIAEKAKLVGAKQVELLPTVVDLARYAVTPHPQNKKFVVGWIGSPSTTPYLELVRPALHTFCQRHDAEVVAVGAAPLAWSDVPLRVMPWSEESEVDFLQTFDVGIMPLQDTPWERGKCGLKLIQYMACARPIIGTPVGVNQDLIIHGKTGLQARSPSDWLDALEQLASDAPLRERLGEAGRHMVEARYQLAVTAPRLAALLHQACR